MPNDTYRALANKIRYFYEEHNNKFDVADFYTAITNSNNEKILSLLNEILNMELNLEINQMEIDDYFKVITEFNIKSEVKRIDDELKQNIDINLKKEKLKKIVELKLRGEKND